MSTDIGKLFEKDPAQAEAALVAQLKKNPADVQGQVTLGAVRMKLGKYPEAADAFRAALKTEPGNLPAQVLLATALEGANNIPQALSAWQAVAKADPVSSAASTVTKRISPSRYTSRTTSPGNDQSPRVPANGTSASAIRTAARPSTGPARNTHVVVRL